MNNKYGYDYKKEKKKNGFIQRAKYLSRVRGNVK